jgi:hypothetical protein
MLDLFYSVVTSLYAWATSACDIVPCRLATAANIYVLLTKCKYPDTCTIICGPPLHDRMLDGN